MPARKTDPRNTTQSLLRAHVAAAAKPVLAWPPALELPSDETQRSEALNEFDQVLKGRNAAHWKPHHASLVGEYALISGQIRTLMKQLNKFGPLTKSPNNPSQLIRSPLLDALTMLQSNRSTLVKQLGLSGAAAEGDGLAKAAQEASVVQRRINDPLLAGYQGCDLLG
jgi:hypothetical protein